MTVRILRGDCRPLLRALPAGSVHAVATSPPYWGLRDYKIPPSIWGGGELCVHDFSCEIVTAELRRGLGMEELSKSYRGGGKKAGQVENVSATTGTCRHCGAWRGCLGLEPTPEMFVDHMVEVFEEVRRVLRDDGTLWLNIGDSYYSPRYPGGVGDNSTINGQQTQEELRLAKRVQRGGLSGNKGYTHHDETFPNRSMKLPGLKPKDLVGVPWMLAFALRRAGWYLRQEIIWHKPNPMPESTRDRCTKAHEQVFLLAKSERYYYDADAIAEAATMAGKVLHGSKTGEKDRGDVSDVNDRRTRIGLSARTEPQKATRNKRSVWTVATQPFKEAHFATFPPDLVEPMIKASTSERGCCRTCGAGWERVTAKERNHESGSGRAGRNPTGKGGPNAQHDGTDDDVRNGPVITTVTLGWYPGCDCAGLPDLPPYPDKPKREEGESDAAYTARLAPWHAECRDVDRQRADLCRRAEPIRTVPAVVLDPFGGAGTTGLVADRLQRDAILCELNPDYAAMAERRIAAEIAPLFGSTVAAE